MEAGDYVNASTGVEKVEPEHKKVDCKLYKRDNLVCPWNTTREYYTTNLFLGVDDCRVSFITLVVLPLLLLWGTM